MRFICIFNNFYPNISCQIVELWYFCTGKYRCHEIVIHTVLRNTSCMFGRVGDICLVCLWRDKLKSGQLPCFCVDTGRDNIVCLQNEKKQQILACCHCCNWLYRRLYFIIWYGICRGCSQMRYAMACCFNNCIKQILIHRQAWGNGKRPGNYLKRHAWQEGRDEPKRIIKVRQQIDKMNIRQLHAKKSGSWSH